MLETRTSFSNSPSEPMWLLELISLFAAVFHMATGTRQQRRQLPDPLKEEPHVVVGRLEQQLSEQRLHAEELQKKLGTTANALREMKTELRRTEKDLSSFEKARHGLQREVDSLRKSNADLAASQAATQDESGALRESLREMTQILEAAKGQVVEMAELKKEFEVVKKDNQEKTHELRHLRQVLGDTESLLDTRSRELREAQAYMTKADNISHADVQRKVEKLNSSIFQLSAQIADSMIFEKSRPHSAELEKSYENIASLLSPATAKLLFHTLHVEDYVWVQNGLQALLAKLSSRIVTAWDVKMISAGNLLLSDIHQVLFNEEPQAVSARWRGLVRRSLRKIRAGQDLIQADSERMATRIIDILRISGAKDINPSATLPESYRSKVRDIVQQSLDIQRSIGEEVVSSDFRIVCPSYEAPFSPKIMEDVNDCGRRRAEQVPESCMVLCTTELGLRRREKVAQEEGVNEIVTTTLMKAKVALCASVKQVEPKKTA